MFPANVYAAQSGASLRGRSVTLLGVRTTHLVIFIICAVSGTSS